MLFLEVYEHWQKFVSNAISNGVTCNANTSTNMQKIKKEMPLTKYNAQMSQMMPVWCFFCVSACLSLFLSMASLELCCFTSTQ